MRGSLKTANGAFIIVEKSKKAYQAKVRRVMILSPAALRIFCQICKKYGIESVTS